MKKTLFPILLCAMLLLSGCSGPVDDNTDTKAPMIEKSETEIPEASFIPETDEPSLPDAFAEDARAQYAGLYDAAHIFTDMYMAEKAWLIGDENIVQLVSAAGFNDVTVLTRNSIERIEQAVFFDFAAVSVIDKTGKTLSLTISPTELLAIIELLK